MSDGVQRLSAALADRYVIEREVGAGGMATVYLAHDVRHDRKVALKVLRPELSAILGAGRFLAEIKTTANLQHPHILPLHDSGEADGLVFYVMPYVEGESLRDRLSRGKQLPVEEAVRIAREVADALEYAHGHGIVHRDIKPENILLHGGHAMVADFGIALAASRSEGGTRMTETGMSLGTPQYMSPEQAMGEREITPKADIYALGCVLYEMLTAEPPFVGATAQAIIARVMTEEPRSLTLQRHTIPPHVDAAVRMALEKLPADRFASAAQFAEALARADFVAPAGIATAAVRRAGAPRFRLAALAPWLAAVVALAAAAAGWLRRPPVAPVQRFAIVEGDSTVAANGIAISPDGRTLVYGSARLGNQGVLLARSVDQAVATGLPGTEGGFAPAFSPDGRYIAFFKFAPIGLYRTTLTSSEPVLLTDSVMGLGAAWGPAGAIYFTHANGGLARIPMGGGPIELLLPADSGIAAPLVWPAMLPGGTKLLVTRFRFGTGLSDVLAVDLRDRSVRVLTAGMGGRYLPMGLLVYATANGALLRAPFDVRRMEITGPPEPIASALAVPGFGYAPVTVSETGTLIYQTSPGGSGSDAAVVVVDRSGGERRLPIPSALYNSLALSPDGRRLAIEITDPGQDGGRIVTVDLGDSVVARFTFDGVNTYPAFTADGRSIAFSRFADGERDLAAKPASGAGRSQALVERAGAEFEVAFSPDGRWLLYRTGNASAEATLGLRVRRTDGTRDTVFLDRQNVAEWAPAFSPDGRWVAYVSNETGAPEVHVRPFPDDGSGAVWQVSLGGGTEPVWARSGRELFYKGPEGLMAASLRTGATFAVAERRRLFSTAPYLNNQWHARYAVLPGDSRFIMIRTTGGSGRLTTHVVLNWFDELRRGR